jgi:hypothetical protein
VVLVLGAVNHTQRCHDRRLGTSAWPCTSACSSCVLFERSLLILGRAVHERVAMHERVIVVRVRVAIVLRPAPARARGSLYMCV